MTPSPMEMMNRMIQFGTTIAGYHWRPAKTVFLRHDYCRWTNHISDPNWGVPLHVRPVIIRTTWDNETLNDDDATVSKTTDKLFVDDGLVYEITHNNPISSTDGKSRVIVPVAVMARFLVRNVYDVNNDPREHRKMLLRYRRHLFELNARDREKLAEAENARRKVTKESRHTMYLELKREFEGNA